MTQLYLEKEAYCSVTRTADEDDGWDRDSTSTSWSFGPIHLNENGNWMESFNTDFDVNAGDVVYVVVPVWSTGDSFGNDEGSNSEVFGCFKTFEEANNFKNELESPKETGDYSLKYKIGDREIYIPWGGYFESLDYIEIVSGVVT